MKKTKKALASLAIAGMALTMVPFNAFATSTVPPRLAGTTAAQTAVAIADQTGWTGTAILASSASYGMVDALTAGPLASYLKAPILLTGAGNTLDPDTKAELTKLNVKKVYVTSGTAVISQAVLDQLSGMGITVVSLGGVDRAATSVNIAKQMGTVTKVAVANGLQDALSIAAVASAAGEPILLTDKNALPASVSAYLAATPGITSSDVIGGTGVISDAVKAALPSATRHAGNTAYDTNNQVIQDFDSSLAYTNVFVANGVTGIDALAGAPLAAQTKSPIVLTDGTVPAAASFVHGKLADGAVVTALGGAAVVSDAVRTGIVTGSAPAQGSLAVTSVSAVSASEIQVKFNQAPADTSKVTFSVTRSGTPATFTPSWDAAKTVATLTYSSNLPEDTYAVDVKNDTADLGSTNVSITTQKIAKIEISSTTLGVSSPTTVGTTTTGGNGYATYKVLDQYGNDISTSALAQGITWTCGVGNATGNNGLLTVTPFAGATNFLTSYTTATVNAIDQTTGVTATANLSITQSQGTLSNIALNKVYCSNNSAAVLTAGDTTDTFYIDYTATDLSGNDTKNFNLINAGLMSSNGTLTGLISSNPNAVSVSLVNDPSNTNNALIQITPTSNASSIVADQPVVITAFTSNGKSGSISVTLKKAATLNKFTLYSPSQTVAAGDTHVVIPFIAVDQNGVTLTKYSDINNQVTITGPTQLTPTLIDNPDGSAALVMNVAANAVVAPLTSQSYTLQSVTKSNGQFSSLNIVVQAAAVPNTLSVTTTQAVPNMESGAVQNLDFGANFADLAVKDQYGRVMNMSAKDGTATATSSSFYYVNASAPTGSSVTVTSARAYGDMNIQLKATGAVGSGSTIVTYKVMKWINPTDYAALTAAQQAAYAVDGAGYSTPVSGVSNVTQQYTVVAKDDIKSYSIDPVSALYDVGDSASTTSVTGAVTGLTASQKKAYIGSANIGDFDGEPNVFGVTSGGGKVALAQTDILSASVDNTSDFIVDWSNNATNTETPYVAVYALNTLNSTKPTATGNLTVALRGQDGLVYTASAALNSKNEAPVAQSVGFKAKREGSTANAGTGIYTTPTWTGSDVSGNNITMTAANFNAHVVGQLMSKYDAAGANASASWVYLYGVDQYGTKNAPITTFVASTTSANYTLSVNPATHVLSFTNTAAGTAANGLVAGSGNPKAGDVITLTGVTSNGLVESVNVYLN